MEIEKMKETILILFGGESIIKHGFVTEQQNNPGTVNSSLFFKKNYVNMFDNIVVLNSIDIINNEDKIEEYKTLYNEAKYVININCLLDCDNHVISKNEDVIYTMNHLGIKCIRDPFNRDVEDRIINYYLDGFYNSKIINDKVRTCANDINRIVSFLNSDIKDEIIKEKKHSKEFEEEKQNELMIYLLDEDSEFLEEDKYYFIDYFCQAGMTVNKDTILYRIYDSDCNIIKEIFSKTNGVILQTMSEILQPKNCILKMRYNKGDN